MAGLAPNAGNMALFDGIPTMLIGAHAAAAYAPPRHTMDVDCIVDGTHYSNAEARMREAGWIKINNLVFLGSHLGLVGGAWSQPGIEEKDIMTSGQIWLEEAFALPPVLRNDGERVIPRDYLILMKMDSARGHDQGDLTRILGRMSDAEVERTIEILKPHLNDENMIEDILHYVEIGRWEYETGNVNMDDGRDE